MAKVTFQPGIMGVSGSVGDLVFRTYRNGKTTVYKKGGPRKTAVTEEEKARRRRFGVVSSIVCELQAGMSDVKSASEARKRLWNQVGYHYDKVLGRNPRVTDDELKNMIRKHFVS